MADKVDNIPDKQAYQINRRLMCWAALALMSCMIAAMLIAPDRYEKVAGFDMAIMSLAGLISVYFGATSFQAKR